MTTEPDAADPDEQRGADRALRLSFVGLVMGVLVGLGVGYLAWGTDPGTTVPGRVGLSPEGDTSADDLVQQGLALHTAGDTAGAARKYDEALAIDPENTMALYNLGVIAHFDGDLDTARTRYEAALATEPDFVRALYNLGLVLRDLGDTDGAVARLERAIELQPDHAGALENLGNLLIEQGDTTRGQELLDRAAALATTGT